MIFDIPPCNADEIIYGQDSYIGWANEDKEMKNLTDSYCSQLANNFENKIFLRISLKYASEIAKRYKLESHSVFHIEKSSVVWWEFLPNKEAIEEQMYICGAASRPIIINTQQRDNPVYANIAQCSLWRDKNANKIKISFKNEILNNILPNQKNQIYENYNIFSNRRIPPSKPPRNKILLSENDINKNKTENSSKLTEQEIKDLQYEVFGDMPSSLIIEKNNFPEIPSKSLTINKSESLKSLSCQSTNSNTSINKRFSLLTLRSSFRRISIRKPIFRSQSIPKKHEIRKRLPRLNTLKTRIKSRFSLKRLRKNT